MLPVPDAERPIFVLSFVHVYEAPDVPEKLIGAMFSPLHLTMLEIDVIVGIGITFIDC